MEQPPIQPTAGGPPSRAIENGPPVLDVRHLKKYFPATSGLLGRTVGLIKAVDDVSFFIRRGETLGLVGESGCGKTTTARCILQLERPTSGEILFEGRDLTKLSERALRAVRPKLQVIFQDPYSSLNPRMTIGQIIGEPLTVYRMVKTRKECGEQVADLLSAVGMDPAMVDGYPHELSGGQRQRVGICRALALRPSLIVCDEPVSALDVSIQAQIVNLLEALQRQFELAYLFVAHDLSMVRHISARVAVMYLGKIVELADRREVYEHPLHPYTQALIAAVPTPDPVLEAGRERIPLKGEVPSPLNPPSGCVFHPRCPLAIGECQQAIPELRQVRPNHWVACIRV